MKSKDPEFKMLVDSMSFRCNLCDYPVLKTTGAWNEVEPGLATMVCADCYKPKKDPKNFKEELP